MRLSTIDEMTDARLVTLPDAFLDALFGGVWPIVVAGGDPLLGPKKDNKTNGKVETDENSGNDEPRILRFLRRMNDAPTSVNLLRTRRTESRA